MTLSADRDPDQSGISGASRLSGWFDAHDPVRETTVRIDRDGPSTVLVRGDWISARISAADGDAFATDDAVLLVTGHPLLDGRPVAAADLATRLLRDPAGAMRLGGRFSVILCDRRHRTMQAITDRFGVWPICWCLEESRLAFSDRADSVPSLNPQEVEPQALFDYLYFHVIPAPRTIYRGIQKLPPSTRLSFNGSGIVLEPTWQPQFAPHRNGSVGELAVLFRDLIRQSVELEAAHPNVGCFLSGGTDSSTVAGTLKQITGRARTFSIGFDQRGYDEMHYARIAARHFGTDHCEHYVTPEQLVPPFRRSHPTLISRSVIPRRCPLSSAPGSRVNAG